MRNFLSSNKARLIGGAGTTLALAMVTETAGATSSGYDITQLSSGVQSQAESAFSAAAPIAGGLIALGIGVRVVRKFVKA